jgi:hypothetical protein
MATGNWPIPGHVERAPAVAGCDEVQAKIDAEQARGYIGQRPAGLTPSCPRSEIPAAGLLVLHRHRARWYFPDLAG